MKRLLNPLCLALALASLASIPRVSAAADIDLYAGSGGGLAAPNVLFFLDNTSNWSSNAQAWKKSEVLAKCVAPLTSAQIALCQSYTNEIFGSDNSLVQGQIEVRALKLVLNKLVCTTGAKLAGKVSAGIMLMNEEGTTDGNSDISGYIRHRVTLLDAAQCAVVTADLDNISNNITTPAFKGPSSAAYDSALYEAFKYFGGWTNPAGSAAETAGTPVGADGFGPIRHSKKNALEDSQAFTNGAKTTYKSPISDTNTCGNNYIVLVGNTWPNQASSTNPNVSPYPSDTNLNTRLGWPAQAQFYPKPLNNSDKSNVRFGDEWAKFLFTTDVSSAPSVQNIKMFTIDVYNASADAKQGALLKSMADQTGPGGYFSVGGDLYKLVNAFEDVLTKIASVNSVFASASLPVSVNAQGTFLNQVFMGVFRPDADAQQRWSGNLKQYKFALDGPTAIKLVDSAGKSAVDSQKTGFIDNCAVSYWSSSNTYWSSIAGTPPGACSTAVDQEYSDAPDGPVVERGGAGQRLRQLGHAARNIRTCNTLACASLVDFDTTNVTSVSATLVNWARGVNNGDGSLTDAGVASSTDYGLGATATRPTVHGEVVHSRPLAINYGTSPSDDVVVFYGAGDGMLHAINGNQNATDGNELWAFIAPDHWSALDRVRTNNPKISYPNYVGSVTPPPTPKQYFFDGSIGGYQERSGGASTKIFIYPTMRRGGNKVYAFNVTAKPGTLLNQPSLLWKFGCTTDGSDCGGSTGESQMGQSWSTPVAIRVKGQANPLVVFGAGYNSCEDAEDSNTACGAAGIGSGIYVMDAQYGPGTAYRFFGPSAGLDSTAGRFVADMTTVDVNGDGFIDVIYAADTRGNLWRINTSDPANSFAAFSTAGPAGWRIQKIATVGQWGAGTSERRKFMYAPSVVVLGTQVTVLIGTGDREKPISTSAASSVNNRFYGIRDDVTNLAVTPVIGYGTAAVGTNLTDLLNVTGQSTIDLAAVAAKKGWFLDLSTTTVPYEQVVTTPLTIAGVTYFNTYQAKPTADSSTTCTNLGTGRGYQIDFQTGVLKPNSAGVLLPEVFKTEGIPPSPVGGVVSIDGKTKPFCIGCAGVSPVAPKQINPLVKAKRKPVYRYQRIDG